MLSRDRFAVWVPVHACSTAWLLSLPDAIEQLEAYDRDVIYRADLQVLLGVSRTRAAVLMREFGAESVGPALALSRAKLIRRFRRWVDSPMFRKQAARRDRVYNSLHKARLAGVRVPVAPGAERGLAGLPPGVAVGPGRIEVRFARPKDAIGSLYALAQALLADYERFEEVARLRDPS